MSRMKCVLFGTGGWGRAHAQALRNCSEVELAGICGHRNIERLNAMRDEYAPGCPVGLELADLLDKVRPDILDVSCNPFFRVEPVRLATACPSVKLINLEKPLALKPSEAYEIEQLCRDRGILLTVNHQKKFLPTWRKVKNLIQAGTLGEISFIRATCQGNLLEQGTHVIDMLLFYNDYVPISWVMGQVGDLEGLAKTASAAPDSAVGVLSFENGVRGLLEIGNIGRSLPGETCKWYQFAVEVYGSLGNALVTLNRDLRVITYADGHVLSEPSSWTDHYVQALTAHLDSLASYIREPEKGHISDLDRSLLSFNAIMAVFASASRGGRIDLPTRFSDDIVTDLVARARAAGCIIP